MHKYVIVILTTFYSFTATPQTNTIDSLTSLLKIEKTDSALGDIYLKLGYLYVYNNTDTAIQYLTKANEIANKANLTNLLASSYSGLGNAYLTRNNYNESFDKYTKALSIWEKSNNKIKICRTIANMGNIFWNKGEYSKANEYYFKAVKIAEDIDDKKSYNAMYSNIGLIFRDLNNQEKAFEYFSKSLQGYKEMNDDVGISVCYQNIGLYYEAQGKKNKAIQYFKDALEITLKNNDQRSSAMLYNNLGMMHESLGNLDSAMIYFKMCYPIFKKVGDKKSTATSLINMAYIFSKLKDYDKAIKYSLVALDIAIETQTLNTQSFAYSQLASIYEEKQQFELALKYHKQFKEMNDSIFSTDMSEQIIELQTKFETEKKEKENELLKRDIELQAYEIKQNKFKSYVLYGSIVVLLILFMATYKRVRIKKKINLELEAKNKVILKQQTKLSEALTHMKELNEELKSQKLDLHNQAVILEEANNTKNKFFSIISHDLKNPFNSILGFVELLAESYDKYSDAKRKDFIKIINTSTKKTYDLLCNLLIWANSQINRIVIIKEKINLVDLVNDSIEPYLAKANSKEISVQNNIPSDYFAYADKYTLSTVFANLFSNAIKFTNNDGSVTFNASLNNNNYYKIDIIDTGIGMSEETIKKLFDISQNHSSKGTNEETGTGLGLLLCKEFVEKNNGKIEVNSKIGVGSTFSVFIPKA